MIDPWAPTDQLSPAEAAERDQMFAAANAPVEPVAPVSPVHPGGGIRTGARLLNDVRCWLGRYICTVHADDLNLLTLWAAHTWLVRETYTTPRLVLDSPMPGSGKTTCLEHLERLCIDPVQMASVSSSALLGRMLENGIRTMLIDEADRSLDPNKDGVGDLISMINSGYKRGGTRPVLTPSKGGRWEVTEMSTFSPVAIAGNSPQLPEDTQQRTIRVLLMPDLDGRAEESDWELIDDQARALGAQLSVWADRIRDDVRTGERPTLPDKITGRFREKWAPLKRIAVHASPEWSEAVDRMALHDHRQWEQDKEDGMIRERPAVMLARHLHAIWDDTETFLSTADVLDRLVTTYPSSWGKESTRGKDLTAQGFGRMLAKNFKVNSDREGRGTPRGYYRSALEPVWHRLHIPTPDQTGASGATGETGAEPEAGAA